jgi:hypothetical protein
MYLKPSLDARSIITSAAEPDSGNTEIGLPVSLNASFFLRPEHRAASLLLIQGPQRPLKVAV